MMTGWLKLTDEDRRDTLIQAQLGSGITVKALEKDWWVTLVLKALFQSVHSQSMVFKGGTSLSKGWQLISRFSEDIDISLDPAAFGMTYKENPSKSFVENLKRRGCVFTSTHLRGDLQEQLKSLGLSEGQIVVEAAQVSPTRPDTDPQTLYVRYKSLYAPHPYISDEVKVEVSVRSLLLPYSVRPILSLLMEHFPNDAYAQESFEIPVVDPHKTFLEKAFLLHEEFTRPEKGRIRYKRMSRHFYDLVANMNNGVATQALADHELYKRLIHHREGYNRLAWVDYRLLAPNIISFLPPSELVELYRADYATMQEHMIYGESPDFDAILTQLKRLQEQFRLLAFQ